MIRECTVEIGHLYQLLYLILVAATLPLIFKISSVQFCSIKSKAKV